MRSFCSLLLAFALATTASAQTSARLIHSFVRVDHGVRLAVIRTGDATGAPIVFIPGWSTSGEIWRNQMLHYASSRPVVSFDPRSQGASTITTSGNTPEQRARDLHALLATLHFVRAPVLVGWSQGSQDLAAYINQYGSDQLAGVVFVDAPVSAGAAALADGAPAAAQQLSIMHIYAVSPRDYLDGMFHAIISRPLTPEARNALVETGLKTPPSIGVSMLIDDLFGPDRRDALAKIHCPALIIASAQSPELDAQRATAASIPRARFESIDGAAHAVFIDQPERFEAALDRFLTTLN